MLNEKKEKKIKLRGPGLLQVQLSSTPTKTLI